MLERTRSVFLGNNKGRKFETAIWTAKLMLISIGTVSTFLLFKVALIPFIFDSIVPKCLGCLRACLSPPYIYIIVNFIIISIAASSASASDKSTSEENEEECNFVEPQVVKVSAKMECAGAKAQNDVGSFFSTDDQVGACYNEENEDSDMMVVVKREITSFDSFSYSENSPPQDEEDDDYDDSLDGTWKAIIEGKGTVKKPFLKKSDTWNDTRAPPAFPLAERVSIYQKPEMRKSETFNDRVTTMRAGGALRRETLISSQDSLNARVEAFINKFNNDMRMERQQSDMRYMNMVKLKQAAAT